jgi:parallel beta-helix repeat protein
MWYSREENVWLATSSDGLGWTKHLDAPALSPGPSGAWDDDEVYAPHVVASLTGGYEMWYTAEGTTTSEPAIGYAWSDDGVEWTKSPDNPVLTGTTGTWEETGVAYPAVIREGATNYKMWYRGESSGGQAFGQAMSSDGTVWTKHGSNPVLSQGNPTQWGSPVVTFRESSGEAVLDGLTITGGSARYGGGIYVFEALAAIRNCTVTGNAARNYGGGVYLVGTMGVSLIENTVVSSNTAGWAGGIYIGRASSTVSATLIINNAARESVGGLFIQSSPQSTLISTTVANNAARAGGGIEISGGSALNIYSSRIDGNLAGQKAGVWVQHSTLTMTNSFVVDNHAIAGKPGAMSFWRSSGRLVNVTIADNSASNGTGGISFAADQPGGSLVILNSILVFNGNDDLSCSNSACSVAYSDVQEGFAGSGNISADPLFVDRAQGDYHLEFGSPAIDAGVSEGAPATDFEGDPRPVKEVDMGADEFSGDIIKVYLPLTSRGSQAALN